MAAGVIQPLISEYLETSGGDLRVDRRFTVLAEKIQESGNVLSFHDRNLLGEFAKCFKPFPEVSSKFRELILPLLAPEQMQLSLDSVSIETLSEIDDTYSENELITIAVKLFSKNPREVLQMCFERLSEKQRLEVLTQVAPENIPLLLRTKLEHFLPTLLGQFQNVLCLAFIDTIDRVSLSQDDICLAFYQFIKVDPFISVSLLSKVEDRADRKALVAGLWNQYTFSLFKFDGAQVLEGERLEEFTELVDVFAFEALERKFRLRPYETLKNAQVLRNQADYFFIFSRVSLVCPPAAALFGKWPFKNFENPTFIPLFKDLTAELQKYTKEEILAYLQGYPEIVHLYAVSKDMTGLSEFDRIEILVKAFQGNAKALIKSVLTLQTINDPRSIDLIFDNLKDASTKDKIYLLSALFTPDILRRRALSRIGMSALAHDPIALGHLLTTGNGPFDPQRVYLTGICNGWVLQMLSQDEKTVDPAAAEKMARYTHSLYLLALRLPESKTTRKLDSDIELERHLKLRITGRTSEFKTGNRPLEPAELKAAVDAIPPHDGLKLNLRYMGGRHAIYVNPHTKTIIDQNLCDEKGNLRVLTFESEDSFYEGLIFLLEANYKTPSVLHFVGYKKNRALALDLDI